MSGDLASLAGSLFPSASRELQTLHRSVFDNSPLLPVDLLSIHDLLEVAGYRDQEGLHVLLLLMYLALEEGSLSVELSEAGLMRRLADLGDEALAAFWARRILASLDEPGFPKLIGTPLQEARPLLLCAHGGRRHLYFQKFHRSEQVLCDELRKRFRAPGPHAPSTADRSPPLPPDWEPIVREVLQDRPLRQGGRALPLDADQRRALETALRRNLVVISGGPGTGKTSIVLTLLRCLVRAGWQPAQIALAAPTGRAAQRLTDSLRLGLERIGSAADPSGPMGGTPEAADPDALLYRLQAGTLHQLLEYSPSRGYFRRHADNPLSADVVIVDEVSMVGVVLMAQLLQSLRPECKLVLLGDKDQLPSVEAGAVLAGLIAARAQQPDDHVVLLQTNHRSQPDIQAAARAINRQDAGIAGRLPGQTLPEETRQPAWWKALENVGGCWMLEPSEGASSTAQTAELRRVLQRWAAHHFLEEYPQLVRECRPGPDGQDDPLAQDRLRRLFRILESNRILTLVRDGTFGCVGINHYLDTLLRPSLDRGCRGSLFAGAPVLITANDHVNRLYNGDVGVVLRCADGQTAAGAWPQRRQAGPALRAVFPRQGGFASFAVEALPAHELGLALTVHKSQGSEYDSVLLVLPPSGARRLLTKEILYTAVTRARNLVLIAGSRDVLRLAIRRKILRESALLSLDGQVTG